MTIPYRTTTIPKEKWIEIHESILLIQFFANEANHNLQGVNLVNERIKTVMKQPLKLQSAGILVTVGWMVLARAYETISGNLSGKDIQDFYKYLVSEVDSHCQLKSFKSLKNKYRLNIQFLDVDENDFQQALWTLVKMLRNAISHSHYKFDRSCGNTANKVLVKINHSHSSSLKLKMDVFVEDYFLFVEHLGVWIDTTVQKYGFLGQ